MPENRRDHGDYETDSRVARYLARKVVLNQDA